MNGAQALKSGFARDVLATFGTKMAAAGVGLLTSVLVARSLGPDGRGAFATVMTLAAIGMQFANLGLHSSNSYYLARDRSILPAVVANSLAFALVLGSLAGVLLTGVAWASGVVASAGAGAVGMAMASIPAGLAYLLLVNLLLPLQAVAAFNRIEFGLRLVMFALTGLAFAAMMPSVALMVGASLLAHVYGIAAVWKVLRTEGGIARGHASRELLREQLPFALRAYLGSLFSFLVVRSDILMVQAIGGNSEAGHYAIAVTLADLIYMLPLSAGMLLFPRLAAMSDPTARRRATWQAAGVIAAAMIVISIIAAALAEVAVGLLYGAAFLPAVPMFQILLGAVSVLGVSGILSNHLAATGFPWSAVWVWGVGFVVNVALNLALVPGMGEGAALASIVAYALVLLVQCYLVLREQDT